MIKKLLQTSGAFDDSLTNLAILIYDTLDIETDNAKEYTFYFFQDFSYGLTDISTKNKIGSITFKRQDFIDKGYTTNKVHIVHFLRSTFYAKLSNLKTLHYFSKINLQT
jgi:hypothetical protein